MGTIRDLVVQESAAQHEIEVSLSPLVALADQTYLLLGRAMDAVARWPRTGARTVAATKVCAILAARLQNELRVCCTVSCRGYGLQGMGLAATMAELLGVLSYIGDNEERAIEWAKHVDHRKTYPPRVNDGIDAVAAALDMTESDASLLRDQLRGVYTMLCMAKHANPRLSMEQGMHIVRGDAYYVRGPDASRMGIVNSCYALLYATWFGLMGVHIFAKRCNDASLRAELQNESRIRRGERDNLDTVLADMFAPEPIEQGLTQ
jgi:hypothetical protein